MTPSQIIQRIHEEARRPEVHEMPRLYRAAVAREAAWKKMSTTDRREVLAFAEGDFALAAVAIDCAIADTEVL